MLFDRGQYLEYAFDNETVRIEPWGKDAFRVRATRNPAFTDKDWALEDTPAKQTVKINIVEDKVEKGGEYAVYPERFGDHSVATITNGKITATMNAYGVITFTNDKGEVLLKENWRRKEDEPSMPLKSAAREFRPVTGNFYNVHMRFIANDGEKIYGMGQYQQQYMDMKGCFLELAHRNTQVSIPFYISSIGYGFLWNNPAIGSVAFGKNGTEWIADTTQQIDYWITAGDTPMDIERNYMEAVGKPPMMPDYGMGFWQCKLRYQTQEELLKVAREHKKRGLPMDVIVIDFFHWTQQGEYKLDPEYWPDPKAMCKELEEMGIKVMVSIWPTVDYRSENFDEMIEKGYLVRTEKGVRVTMQKYGQEVFIDPTNPGCREYVWEKAKQNYWDNGIRLFWLDEAEPEYTAYDYDNYRYYLGSVQEVGNCYPVYYAKGFYDGMKQTGYELPMNLLRCAWAGSAKYGALVWSGDVDSTFESFKRQVKAGLSMAIAGIPWWTTDIGGFRGGDIRDDTFKNLLVRWFQWSCFCPVFRLHGYRKPEQGFTGDVVSGIGLYASGADNEVWSYGEDNYEILKEYLFIRERIRPYVKAQMELAAKDGTPVMRPVFFDFPADAKAWETEDAYLFGPDLLVAPVTDAFAESKEVYLPSGAKWTNVWTGETVDGGTTVTVDAPLAQIPLFTRDGAVLPIRA